MFWICSKLIAIFKNKIARKRYEQKIGGPGALVKSS